jgi:DNA polymerase elongation subunit (family B)
MVLFLCDAVMRVHGVCPSHYVRQDNANEIAASQQPGVVVVKHQISEQQTVLLATPTSGNKAPFTRILEKLLAERAAVRKLQKKEKDPIREGILNCRQMSRKITCNAGKFLLYVCFYSADRPDSLMHISCSLRMSAYGLLGAKKGYMPLPDLAAVTTFQGREVLKLTQHIIESEYGGHTIAGDTDSIMFQLGAVPGLDTVQDRMNYVFEKGALICNDITGRLPAELVFELEGVLWPAAFYKKKCYVAQSWECAAAPKAELKMKGICAVRNDRSKWNKRISIRALDLAIRQGDAEAALQFLVAEVKRLNDRDIPLLEFIFSKNLKSLSAKSPHVELVKRLPVEQRPILGAKVEYVITDGQDLSGSSRRPEDVTVGDIDTKWYFETQILKPLVELLSPIHPGGAAALKRMLVNTKNGQQTITSCMENQGKKRRL